MKKVITKILLFISIFIYQDVFASTVDYEAHIDNDRNISESITYHINENETKKELTSIVANDVYFDKVRNIRYDKKISLDNNSTIVKLTHKYNVTELKNNDLLKRCFDHFDIEYDDYRISFFTYGDFKCYKSFDKVLVSITSDMNVMNNSADTKTGNNYIWNNIDKDLYINLELGEMDPNSKDLKPVSQEDEGTYDNINTIDDGTIDINNTPVFIYILIPILVIAVAIVIYLKKIKYKKNSKKNEKDENN